MINSPPEKPERSWREPASARSDDRPGQAHSRPWDTPDVTAIDRVMLFDEDAERAASIASSLESIGLSSVPCHRGRDAVAMLRRESPAVAVVVGGEARLPRLSAVARPSGI